MAQEVQHTTRGAVVIVMTVVIIAIVVVNDIGVGGVCSLYFGNCTKRRVAVMLMEIDHDVL